MISLCTWCKDWPPLREVLPVNLERIAGRQVEWCITDLESSDDTYDWLLEQAAHNCQLRIFRRQLEPLHFARGYNLAFAPAVGDVLVCLDADNLIGPQFIDCIEQELEGKTDTFLHIWSGNWADGTCGRLVFPRHIFEAVGGYDETLLPIGHQDIDLRDRAQAAGYLVVNRNDPDVVGSAILTDDKEKMQYLPQYSYQALNHRNVERSRKNLEQNRWRANT